MLMPAALTMTATSRVPVYLNTQEMDSPVQVSYLTSTFARWSLKRDSLYLTVTLTDYINYIVLYHFYHE